MNDQLEQNAVSISVDLVVKRLIEASSVLLLVGFVASLIINGFVFSRWSISYLGVASTSDVLMDGMYFLFDLGYALIAVVFGLVGPRIVGLESHLRSLARILPFYAILMVVLFVGFIELRPRMWRSPIHAPDSDWFVQIYSSAFALGVIGIVCATYCLFRPSQEEEFWGRPWMYKTTLVLLVCATLIGFLGLINYRRDIGYFESYLVLTEQTDPCDNKTAQVVWVGADFSAARCSPNAEVRLFRTDAIDYLKSIRGREIRCEERWLLALRRCRYVPNGKG